MRRPPVLCLTAVLLLASAVAACDKAGAAPAPAPAANASTPVTWDYTSKDPAKNPDVANKEASVPGFNP